MTILLPGVQETDKGPALWWQPDGNISDDERRRGMISVAKLISSGPDEQLRLDRNLLHARMFESSPLANLYRFGGSFTHSSSYNAFSFADVSTWNVARSAVQTAAAQVSRNKIRVKPETTNGDYKQKRAARKLTTFCDGLTSDIRLYEFTQQAFIDGGVMDAGGLQLYEDDDDRVRLQRVLSSEYFVDPAETLLGSTPRTLYRHRYMSKDSALNKWGKKGPLVKAAISLATTVDPLGIGDSGGRMIEVWEAWHLPSKKGADDGLHIIGIDKPDGFLFKEQWTKSYFTTKWFLWEKALSGFWGRSLMEQALPSQVEINRILTRIEKAQRLMCAPKVGVARGSKIIKSQLSNEVGGILEYTNTAPVAITWPALAPEVYKQLDAYIQKIYDLAGVNRNASAGQKEADLESGEALRASLDIQQARMSLIEDRWERYHVDIMEVAVDMARDIAKRKDGYEVRSFEQNGRGMNVADWNETKAAEDSFALTFWPSGILPITPAGRIDTVKDLINSGIWTVQRGAAALDELDPESEMGLQRAAEANIERQMEGMLYDGEQSWPDESTDIQQAISLSAKYVNLGEQEKCPAKNVDLVRRYMDALTDLQAAAKPAAPAPGQPAAGAPVAPPAATPAPGPVDAAGAPGAPPPPAAAPMAA